jgi:hypothetical protein
MNKNRKVERKKSSHAFPAWDVSCYVDTYPTLSMRPWGTKLIMNRDEFVFYEGGARKVADCGCRERRRRRRDVANVNCGTVDRGKEGERGTLTPPLYMCDHGTQFRERER